MKTVSDVVGHMKLVDGQTLIERPRLDDVKIATTRHIMIHVQSHDGSVMKLYLWDQAATDFCKKFNSCENTPTVLLVTTVNTKRLGGTLALTSMSSTRVFMDYDVQPTKDYLTWLSSNPEIANQVSADVITKRETLTIGDAFLSARLRLMMLCMALLDVGRLTQLALHSTVQRFLFMTTANKLFVLLGDVGRELTGRHASELVSSYFEANKSEGADHEVPVPEALISTIRQTHKFCVKVTDHNFSGNTRAITVTKILYLDTPPPTEASVGNDIAATSKTF
ncbi:hypothetical protein F2Q68_00025079 [Brassica cretica]|uniref:Replication factor A C-terminal domain-containing protein n=1 Tax=Brassica cretica TaxID=69181 RepID=A0A8S9IGC5_BRACR|nr:hypothetical protein F2Q68_00025079 [Brassica cretica]